MKLIRVSSVDPLGVLIGTDWCLSMGRVRVRSHDVRHARASRNGASGGRRGCSPRRELRIRHVCHST